ncbi:MAG: hypothetical protein ABH890_05185 [Bacillota bacterium]
MKRFIQTKYIILLFVCAHLIYLGMDFVIPVIQEGVSLPIFDFRMFRGYDLAYATTFVNELSDKGKIAYLWIQLPLDFIYPLLVSTFFYLFFLQQTKNNKIALIGYSSMIFDYLENILIIVILTSTQLSALIVGTASVVTIIKGVFYVINYGLTIFLLIRCRYKMGCPVYHQLKNK